MTATATQEEEFEEWFTLFNQNYSFLSNLSDISDINNIFHLPTNIITMDSDLRGKSAEDYIELRPMLRIFFYFLYMLIGILGISGNALVCYVVVRNKHMHTVTNLFITNLALSDILLCIFAVPITPLYLIYFKEWVFGRLLCHLVTYAQGVSIYISAFTLTSIAIDRFFVIIYPFKSRMKINFCLLIVISVWISAALLTLPYGLFVQLVEEKEVKRCDEMWSHDEFRIAFGFSTSILQFVIPFIIISFCYMRICEKLRDRARAKPGARSLRKEELEKERTRRINRVLISMVIIFGTSWLPLNILNLLLDFYTPASNWPYLKLLFLASHAIAMSSTCYNPFLYSWLIDNFRKEFKKVLPCYHFKQSSNVSLKVCEINLKQENTCNGHELMNENISDAKKNYNDKEEVKLQILEDEVKSVETEKAYKEYITEETCIKSEDTKLGMERYAKLGDVKNKLNKIVYIDQL